MKEIQYNGLMEPVIREPAVAGLFYPNSEKKLRSDILAYLREAEYLSAESASDIEGDLVSLVVPHAGYVYSGLIAAHAYRLLKGREYNTILLLGPNHRGAGFFGTSVYARGGFKTPLGLAEVDEEIAQSILALNKSARLDIEAHAQEHSLEVQIPFLQIVSPRSKIVPIAMSDYEKGTCEDLAEAIHLTLQEYRNKKFLVIASSDLSHYHSYEKAVQMDHKTIGDIESLDPARLHQSAYIEEVTELCGYGPVLTTMLLALRLGVKHVKTLHYANSGDVTGDKSRVVGYASMALFRNKQEEHVLLEKMEEELLTGEEKQILARFARETLRAKLKKEPTPEISLQEKFEIKKSIFVTLKRGDDLRGCVGILNKKKPLLQSVRDLVVAAALEDSRFRPVRLEELESLSIEISILSDPVEITNIESIMMGKHGLIVQKGPHSGLLLPQVPLEMGWTKEEFLSHACLKAGLMPDAWKEGAEIFIFCTIRFGEALF